MTLPKHRDLKLLSKKSQQSQSQNSQNQFFDFLNKPFWINDPVKHEIAYHNPKAFAKCCFNHIIGLPRKNGLEKRIFDYEQEIAKYLQHYRNLWIKKARGLGLTEFMLRYITYLCVSSNRWKGWRAHIITGPRSDLAEEEIRRIKSLFPDALALTQTAKDTCVINGVTIQAFPSNAIAMRGYDNVFFIFLDEADFFRPAEQIEARNVAEGYRLKSNPWIVMVSTPNRRGGIYETIEKQPEEEHGYKKLEYLYERGLNKIYDAKEIEREKTKAYFKREYCGQYDFDIGNLFNTTILDAIESLGNERVDFDNINAYTNKSLGIDVGYGSSKTAFTVTEYIDGYIRVIYSKAFARPISEEMINHAVNLIFHYQLNRNGNQVYCDAANPGFIRSLKIALGEEPEYEQIIQHMRRGFENKHIPLEGSMTVIPIPFSIKGETMLERLKTYGDNQMLAINAEAFPDLMSDLRTARTIGLKLEKNKLEGQTMDLLDSLRLALEFYQSEIPIR